jgi:hypothetical protein
MPFTQTNQLIMIADFWDLMPYSFIPYVVRINCRTPQQDNSSVARAGHPCLAVVAGKIKFSHRRCLVLISVENGCED